MPEARTNLKRGVGNTEDSLRNWVQLLGVNVLLVLCGGGRTDLCDGFAIFHHAVQGPLNRSAHEWIVSI